MSSAKTDRWDEAIERMLDRVEHTAATVVDGFPHFADTRTGEWTVSSDGDWTGSFFIGQLWLGAAVLGRVHLLEVASEWAERLLPRVHSATVFRGFLFWYGAALGQLLADDARAGDIADQGASGFAESFDPVARLFPLGASAEEAHSVGPSETNIDGVPGGTPLIAWSANRLGAPERRDLAIAHACRHIELCVRGDGSVVQSASFDPVHGGLIRQYTHKGVRDDSTWTRAQAWAMLGLAQAAAISPGVFGSSLERVCDWWIEHLPADNVTRWDFDENDNPDAPIDTSGTAIGAASLLKADAVLGGRSQYRSAAVSSVDALLDRYLDQSGALTHGCYNNRIGLATCNELVWGDYFLLESLAVLTGRLDTRRV